MRFKGHGEKDEEEELENKTRRITHSMTDVERRYLDWEKTSTYKIHTQFATHAF